MTGIRFKALVLAFAAALALTLVGCGGEMDRARGYVESGDAALTRLRSTSSVTAERASALFDDAASSMSSGDATVSPSFVKDAGRLKTDIEAGKKEAGRARAEFEMAAGLEGAQAYGEYAELQVAVIDAFLRGLNALDRYLDSSIEIASAGDFDPAAFITAADSLSSEIESLAKETAALEKKAERLRQEKLLEPQG